MLTNKVHIQFFVKKINYSMSKYYIYLNLKLFIPVNSEQIFNVIKMCFWVEGTTETRFILNLVSYSNQYTTGGKSSSWSTYHSPESKVPATLARIVSVWMALTPVHRQALKTWVMRVGHRHERSYVIKLLSFYDIVSMVNFSFNLCRTTSNASAVLRM